MFTKPSLFLRLFWAKSTGLVIGLIGLLLMPTIFPEAGWDLRLAVVFWYTTLGAMVALSGVIIRCPVTGIRFSWFLRGSLIGGWMNFVLLLFINETLTRYLMNAQWTWLHDISVWWVIVEGALVGLLCDFLATRRGGEGKETVARF